MDLEDSCNCFSKLRIPSLKDTLSITDRNKLPVTGFAYGPFTSENAQAAIRLENLECFGYAPFISTDDCNAVTILNDGRLEFFMEYVNSKDCYAEIKFQGKVNLKLTVENFQVSGSIHFIMLTYLKYLISKSLSFSLKLLSTGTF